MRRRRFNGSGESAEDSLEWVGGRVSPPFVIDNSEETYRPELVLWVEGPSGLVVGHDVVGPENSQGALARSALATPRHGDGPMRQVEIESTISDFRIGMRSLRQDTRRARRLGLGRVAIVEDQTTADASTVVGSECS